MARVLALLLALAPLASGYAFTARRSVGSRQMARRATGAAGLRMESFGFEFAENPNENTPAEILGEFKYKTKFVKSYKPKSLLLTGEPYPLFAATQEKRLLSATADAGLLSQLSDLGFGLSDIEKILPVLEQNGLLSLAGKNLPFLLNVIGSLVVEPGQVAIPTVTALLKVPAVLYQAAAVGIVTWDIYTFVAGIEPDLLGIGLRTPLTLLSLPIVALLWIV